MVATKHDSNGDRSSIARLGHSAYDKKLILKPEASQAIRELCIQAARDPFWKINCARVMDKFG
jgi:hypothetical protein